MTTEIIILIIMVSVDIITTISTFIYNIIKSTQQKDITNDSKQWELIRGLTEALVNKKD